MENVGIRRKGITGIMRKKAGYSSTTGIVLTAVLLTVLFLAACGSQPEDKKNAGMQKTASQAEPDSETEIQVFIAASLQKVMAKLAEDYHMQHPQVKITLYAESSGTLLTQIEEGYTCDLFFSAAEEQMDQLEQDGLVVEGTRADVVRNEVVVIARKDSGTKVTGPSDLENAQSIVLAGGSVPVGRYTRQALVSMGKLEAARGAVITAAELSKALGGVPISEQGNVSKVLLAVLEGSCEVGTVYLSDLYGYKDELKILETICSELSGDVVYPAAQVVNPEADETQRKAAADFLTYLLSEKAKTVFEAFDYKPAT